MPAGHAPAVYIPKKVTPDTRCGNSSGGGVLVQTGGPKGAEALEAERGRKPPVNKHHKTYQEPVNWGTAAQLGRGI